MNQELIEYFEGLGCAEVPDVNPRDELEFLRSRAACRSCPGLNLCLSRGSVSSFILSADGTRASLAVGPCKQKKAQNAMLKAEKLFAEAAIPPSLQVCTLEGYVTDGLGDDIAKAKTIVAKTIEDGASLVLSGDVGTGKTHLAVTIAQAALKRGASALFISAITYLERLRKTFEKKQNSSYAAMVEHAKSVDCLVVDDLGAEKPSPWSVERIYDVLNTRVEQSLQTVVTTNLTGYQELADHLGGVGGVRIASRLMSLGWLRISGSDYRLKMRRKAK